MVLNQHFDCVDQRLHSVLALWVLFRVWHDSVLVHGLGNGLDDLGVLNDHSVTVHALAHEAVLLQLPVLLLREHQDLAGARLEGRGGLDHQLVGSAGCRVGLSLFLLRIRFRVPTTVWVNVLDVVLVVLSPCKSVIANGARETVLKWNKASRNQ